MLKSLFKIFFTKKKNNPIQKVLLTLFILFLFRLGNTIPISGIDQDALKKAFSNLESRNALMQIINMYSGGGNLVLTSFSLGIIPYINASILIDLLTALFPSLEKLQSEEGEVGRKKITFYKKLVTLLFSIVQGGFLIFYLKDYFYNSDLFSLGSILLEVVSGSMILVWLSTIIDNKGIGNGTSLIIFTNIISTVIGKSFLIESKFQTSSFTENTIQIIFLLILVILICISQTARINIDVVSARQLAFLENLENGNKGEKKARNFKLKDNGLSIRLNQAGIFPIIIASNILPFISFLTENFKFLNNLIYYLLIIVFNYFYTIIFWDPEKISEQLRKASVSVVNITPGKETISYLENVVRSSSITGGICLCCILLLYELMKQFIDGYLLNLINISSLIILVGVAYDLQKTLRSLYKNSLNTY